MKIAQQLSDIPASSTVSADAIIYSYPKVDFKIPKKIDDASATNVEQNTTENNDLQIENDVGVVLTDAESASTHEMSPYMSKSNEQQIKNDGGVVLTDAESAGTHKMMSKNNEQQMDGNATYAYDSLGVYKVPGSNKRKKRSAVQDSNCKKKYFDSAGSYSIRSAPYVPKTPQQKIPSKPMYASTPESVNEMSSHGLFEACVSLKAMETVRCVERVGMNREQNRIIYQCKEVTEKRTEISIAVNQGDDYIPGDVDVYLEQIRNQN